MRRRRARAGRRRQRRRSRAGRRADRRRGQGAARRRRQPGRAAWPRTSPRRCWRSPTNYSHILFPATAHGKNVAPRVAAKLDVAQISDITKVDQRRHLRAPDLRRQRDRHRAEQRCDQGHHRAHHRLRSRRRPAAAAPPSRRSTAVADSGSVELRRRARSTKSDRPELTAAKIIVSGGRALGIEREVQRGADAAGRQARRRRWAPAAPRSMRAMRPNDWQVGQTGKIVAPQLYIAAGISRRDPAPGRHEGLAR